MIDSVVRSISIVSNQVEECALTDIDVAARGKIAVENCPALRVVYFMSLYMIGLSVKQLFCIVRSYRLGSFTDLPAVWSTCVSIVPWLTPI